MMHVVCFKVKPRIECILPQSQINDGILPYKTNHCLPLISSFSFAFSYDGVIIKLLS
jgi:hypothetical protein